MKPFLTLLLSLSFFSSNASAQTDAVYGKFTTDSLPQSWDWKGELKHDFILAWTDKTDDRPFQYRSCIALVTLAFYDSRPTEYIFYEYYSNEKPFNKWNLSYVHHGSRDGEFVGFVDTHIKTFTHKPTEKEIYELFQEWDFSLVSEGWTTTESGLDEKLWRTWLGFVPNREFRK